MLGEVLLFAGIVAIVAVVGAAIGILLIAPRLTRFAERDEDPSDGHD
jgi:hypothetical protein